MYIIRINSRIHPLGTTHVKMCLDMSVQGHDAPEAGVLSAGLASTSNMLLGQQFPSLSFSFLAGLGGQRASKTASEHLEGHKTPLRPSPGA